MNKNKQYGMVLVTSLIMLLVMTILSITAIKISTLDLILADNYQKKQQVYQAALSKTHKDANFYWLYHWLLSKNNAPPDNNERLASSSKIIDTNQQYQCTPSNLATSIGPNSNRCHIYMFQVSASMKSFGTKALHYQGIGKLTPNASSGSYLD